MKIERLKKASDEDAFLLSNIAQKAKAHWGYPTEWLALWKEDLTFTPSYLNEHYTFTLSANNQVIGFCIIIKEAEHFEVEHCWISPESIGSGYGSKLLGFVLSQPQFLDQPFQVLSDPNAVGFYQKYGFETIKMIPSKPEGRELPLMRMFNAKQ